MTRSKTITITSAVTCALFGLFCFSCNKHQDSAPLTGSPIPNKEYTIAGTIYNDCSGTVPLAGQVIQLQYLLSASGSCHMETPKTITDSNGHFFLTYITDCDSTATSSLAVAMVPLNPNHGNVPMFSVPKGQSIDLGNQYINKTSAFVINISATGSYSTADTLYYGFDQQNSGYRYPITSGSIPYIYNHSGPTTEENFYWSIGRKKWTDSAFYHSQNPAITAKTTLPGCNGSVRTINVIVQ